MFWHDNMLIPAGAADPLDAITYMNYVYEPSVSGALFVGAHEFALFAFVELEEVVPQYGLSHLLHQAVIERQIVDGQEMPAENLPAFDKVVQVCARVIPASTATAVGVDRFLRKFMYGSPQLNLPPRRENDAALPEL